MRQTSWIRILVLVTLVFSLAACDTFSYVPLRSKAPPVPPEGTEPGAAQPGAAEPGATQPPPGTTAAAPTTLAPMAQAQPDLAQQVQALETRLKQLESRLAEVERPKPTPRAKDKSAAAAQPTAKAASPAAAGSPKTPATPPDKSYSEALRLYQGKKYGQARQKFYQYLKDAPLGPKVPEARYHLADSFYQEGKYKEAAVEFNKMASQNPKSILAPAALLRQSYAYKNLNQTTNYQSTLKKLVHAYPKSPEAKEAQKYLKEKEPKKEGN
ncbi:MAG: tetratricopeptide repeat protein [Desulfobaccales bacterium]|nr:tetratricopeptide repeat protein [Desulfobaccales bacterium]